MSDVNKGRTTNFGLNIFPGPSLSSHKHPGTEGDFYIVVGNVTL